MISCADHTKTRWILHEGISAYEGLACLDADSTNVELSDGAGPPYPADSNDRLRRKRALGAGYR